MSRDFYEEIDTKVLCVLKWTAANLKIFRLVKISNLNYVALAMLVGLLFVASSKVAYADEPTGLIVPLYSYPGSMWDKLIYEKEIHNSLPVIAIINPDNGPGLKDQNYAMGVQKMQNAGIVVLGYVYTQKVDITELRNYIDEYKNWYGVDGIFFDGMSNLPGNETFYKQLSDYAKSMGLTYSVGNPGTDTIPSYIGTVDNLVIHDDKSIPGLSLFDGWHEKYSKKNFSSVSYDVGSIDESLIIKEVKHVQYIYVTDLTMPNPFYALPAYIDKLMTMLDNLQHNNSSISVTVDSVSENGSRLDGMWISVQSKQNSTSGFTPFSFSANPDNEYVITMSNYGHYKFVYWDDRTKNNTRLFTPSKNVTLTAYYEPALTLENQTVIGTFAQNKTVNTHMNESQISSGSNQNTSQIADSFFKPSVNSTGPESATSLLVNIMYYGGDRADYSLLSFDIFQDTNKTVYKEIDSVSSNPFDIEGLPINHRYKIEVFANGMCSDIEYVNLDKSKATLNMYLSPPGGMRPHIFYRDGYTPVSNAAVLVKSQDNKTWAKGITDMNGETLRFWLAPTTAKDNYFIIEVNLGSDISYSSWPVFLNPGSAQEISVVTPWPPMINHVIDINVYTSPSKLYSERDGVQQAVMFDSDGNKIAQTEVTPRGNAVFANLKVGDYFVQVINPHDDSILGQSKVTLDGKQTKFSIYEYGLTPAG